MATPKLISCMSLAAILILSYSISYAAAAPSPRRALMSAAMTAEFINPQNAVRARLGLRPFQWNLKLANFSKLYAKQRQGDCALIHSSGDYGENIFWGQGKKWNISEAVSTWITTEEPYYDYTHNKCAANADCTHYTQIVWRTSLYVGCAKIICNSGDTFITCNYSPHGNVIGERPY